MPNWRTLFSNYDLLNIGDTLEEFPNVPRHFADCAFISHAGIDEPVIREDLERALYERKADGFFLYSSHSDAPPKRYRKIVFFSLYLCRYAIVVVSRNSVGHAWVEAEVDWLLDHRRPIAIYQLDGALPREVHPDLDHDISPHSSIGMFTRSQPQALLEWVDRHDPDGAKREYAKYRNNP